MPDDNGGVFKKALIAAPIIAGGVVSYRNIGGFNKLTTPINPINEANQAVSRFANQYYKIPELTIYKDIYAESIRDMAAQTPLSAEEVRETLLRSAKIADPSGNLAGYFETRLASASTGEEALKDVAYTIQKADSIHISKAARIFSEDIGISAERIAAGMSPLATVQASVPAVRSNISLSSLPGKLRGEIEKMTQLAGARYDIQLTELSRKDIPGGAQLEIEFYRPGMKKYPEFALSVPRVVPGQEALVTRGAQQQSQYIAGMSAIVENGMLKESFKHDEFMVRRFLEDKLPAIMRNRDLSNRAIRKEISNFELEMMQRTELIPYLPAEVGGHEGIEKYIAARSARINLYGSGGKALSDIEFAALIEQGGLKTAEGDIMPLFPGPSPRQIARNVAYTQDVRGAFALVPSSASYGRRPLTALRPEYAPTAEAIAFMQANPINQRFAWAASKAGVETPMMRAMYVSSRFDPELAGLGITSEGQGLITSMRAGERMIKEAKAFNINLDRPSMLGELAPGIESGVADVGKYLPKGTFIGYDPSGVAIKLEEDFFASAAIPYSDAMKGKFARLIGYRDIDRMGFSKVVGGMKGMMREVGPGYMQRILRENLGFENLPAMDALISMEELKKNRHLHYNQMFTSLWELTNVNMKSGKQNSVIASNFINDPAAMIAKMERIASHGDKFSDVGMLRQIKGLARMAKLTPQQMGMVFGAVPDVYKEGIGALGSLSPQEAIEINKGLVGGMTQLFYAAPGGSGSGGMAGFNPRMYEMLGAGHLGGLGTELQTDIAQRMMTAYPERLAEQKVLSESLKSITSLGGRPGALSATEALSAIPEGALLSQNPFSLNLGKLGDIYIPGAAQISQVASYQTASGLLVDSPLAHRYRDVIETAAEYEKKGISTEVMEEQLSDLVAEIHKSRMGTVTAKGGLLRTKLPGSAALTAVQPLAHEQLAPGVGGITAPHAKKMFRGMKQLGIYKEAELAAMREKFFAGEKIPGLIWRFPAAGPYNIQAMEYQLVSGTEDIMMLNEQKQRAYAYAGKLEGESLAGFRYGAEKALKGSVRAGRRLEQLGAEMLSNPIRTGPMPGLSGDFDSDVVGAVFAGPQLEKSLTSHIADQNALEAYEEYSIRSQLLKAKATGEEVTLRKLMAGDVIKLGITEGGRLGKVSIALQEYRAALLSGAGNLSAQENMRALAALDWMENVPIRGKHVAPGREKGLIYSLDQMYEVLNKKSAAGISGAMESFLEKATPVGKAALYEGLTTATEDLATGQVTAQYIPGLDINKTATNLVSAREAMESTVTGKMTAARIRQLILDRGGKATGEEAAQALRESVMGMSPFGALFPGEPTSAFSDLAERALTFANRIGTAGRSMISHAKPLALGGAAALGIAAILSEPPRVLPSGATVAPTGILGRGTSGDRTETNIHPESHISGLPTAQTMEGINSAMVAQPGSPGYRVDVRGDGFGGTDYKELTNQLRKALGNRARINSTISDRRSSLTPQKLSSILQDE